MPKLSGESSINLVWYCPLTVLCPRRRAAVTMAGAMPSPTKRITFLARRFLESGRTVHFATVCERPLYLRTAVHSPGSYSATWRYDLALTFTRVGVFASSAKRSWGAKDTRQTVGSLRFRFEPTAQLR